MKKIYYRISSFVLVACIFLNVTSEVVALNTWDTGYQVTSGQQKDITLADGSCRRITNNATNRFIPTKLMSEWNSFNAVAPSQGVSVGSCCDWVWQSSGYYENQPIPIWIPYVGLIYQDNYVWIDTSGYVYVCH